MSFDLVIFANYKGVTELAVQEAYSDSSIKWESNAIYEDFISNLFSVYPLLKHCDDVQLEESPWANCEVCEGYVVLGFVSTKEKSDPGFKFVLEQAEKLNLVVYDPQGAEAFVGGKRLS
jgi:hypothetical protein